MGALKLVNENEVKVINSREVAEMCEVEHKELLRKIEGTSSGKYIGYIPVLTETGLKIEDFFIKSAYIDVTGRTAKCYLCTVDGVKMVCDNMRNYKNKKNLIEWIDKNTNTKLNVILSNRQEVDFLDDLEIVLAEMDIDGIRQYSIMSYKIDYYIPCLKIAIEYDECGHSGYTYEQHEGRQKEIEEELGCKFVRVSNLDNNLKNIGIIVNYIMKNRN